MNDRRQEGARLGGIVAAFLASAALIGRCPVRCAAAGGASSARTLQGYSASLKARIKSQEAEISRLRRERSADPSASRRKILAAQKAILAERAAIHKMAKLESELTSAPGAKAAGKGSGKAHVSGASGHASSRGGGSNSNPTVDPRRLYGDLPNDFSPSGGAGIAPKQKRMADGFFAPPHAAVRPTSSALPAAGARAASVAGAKGSPSAGGATTVLAQFRHDIAYRVAQVEALIGRIKSLWNSRFWRSGGVQAKINRDIAAAKQQKAILLSLEHARSIYNLKNAISSHQQAIQNLKNGGTPQGAKKIQANEKAIKAERRALDSLKPRSRIENLQQDIAFLQTEVNILREQPSTPYIQQKISDDLAAINREQKAVGKIERGADVSDLSLDPAVAAVAVVKFAMAQLGKPYIYGGECSRGYDCSGLVQAAYSSIGITIPRTTYYQVSSGRAVHRPYDARNLRPGDLILLMGSDPLGNLPGHVGMYVGHGTVIQAPYTGTDIQLTPLSDFGPIVAVRRIL